MKNKIEDQDWQETLESIAEQALAMDAIHDAYPGKENRALRDRLCTPYREVCVQLHYRRIALVKQKQNEK